ncbi:hypothetical protein AAY473_000596, partial [Plecturocebus cupreus]
MEIINQSQAVKPLSEFVHIQKILWTHERRRHHFIWIVCSSGHKLGSMARLPPPEWGQAGLSWRQSGLSVKTKERISFINQVGLQGLILLPRLEYSEMESHCVAQADFELLGSSSPPIIESVLNFPNENCVTYRKRNFLVSRNTEQCQAWWLMPVIPALCKAKRQHLTVLSRMVLNSWPQVILPSLLPKMLGLQEQNGGDAMTSQPNSHSVKDRVLLCRQAGVQWHEILAHCNLRLPGSSDSCALASQVARITAVHHHAWLVFVFSVQMGFYH